MSGTRLIQLAMLVGFVAGCAPSQPPARTVPSSGPTRLAADSLRPDDRIRVAIRPGARWTGGALNSQAWTEGAFDRFTADTLQFRPRTYRPEAVTIAASWIDRVEIGSRGSSHPWRGLLVGMLAGFGVDVIASSSCGNCLYIVPVFTITGSVVGLLAGSPHGTTWRPVSLPVGRP